MTERQKSKTDKKKNSQKDTQRAEVTDRKKSKTDQNRQTDSQRFEMTDRKKSRIDKKLTDRQPEYRSDG